MSWIHKLYDTYENCRNEVGTRCSDEKTPLLPIAHSTQNAQIEVVLNGEGDFLRAKLLEKDEAVTIIPVTEDSATRSGTKPPPHPLCDKLQYVAGDYSKYVDKKNIDEFYNKYIEQLEKWCNSSYYNKKVRAIFNYLKKKNVMSDLIDKNILIVDNNHNLAKVKLGSSDQSDAFVRFRVEIPNQEESAVWLDREIYESHINYYLSLQKDVELCYVKGEEIPCSEKHPAKVRHTGDKAKLISANIDKGFTYSGRFKDKTQVVRVGYEISQKAHNALRWLIDKQGYKNGDQVIIAWGTKNELIPEFLGDTQAGIFGEEEVPVASTEKDFAERLNKAIAGYSCSLDTKAEIVIMGLDAATTGRLSITYYRELDGVDFLNRIKHWHSTCIWKHAYKKVDNGINEKGKTKFKTISFVGAPAPKDIAIVAFGSPRENNKTQKKYLEIKDTLLKATVERLLPCIIDGARLPYDIVNGAVNRTSNPVSIDKEEWQKVLTITCALIKKYKYDKFKEVWEMALDENQRDRSYIFGRLLAIAQQIEEYALYTAGEKRETNAERLMHQFKLHPYKTWGIITDKLRPYIARLGSKATELTELLARVNSMISYEDFTSLRKLDDSYILGYYCQRQIFIEQKNKRIEADMKKKLGKTN